MKLADIPEGPSSGLYLVLADADDMADRVEVIGWTTAQDDAAWWAARPGCRVVLAHAVDWNGGVKAWQ
jgi:hypothetical protein